MILPYLARTLCLILCSAGLLHMALECAAWTLCPGMLRVQSSARRTERTLFAVALASRALPWFLVFTILVPAYLRAEDNRAAEHVSLASVGFAACVLLWSLLGLLHAASTVIAAQRCVRRSTPAPDVLSQTPVLLYSGHPTLIAVAGIFRARILVGPALLEGGRYSPQALAVAFAHERAHVRHRDNLKNLLLSLLPHVALASSKRPSIQQRWRLASEMAADEEGTGGTPENSLLLAGMLVSLARQTGQAFPPGVTALHAGSEHLRLRVENLLRQRSASLPSQPATYSKLAIGGLTLLFSALCALCSLLGHRAAEFLFHGV